MHSLSTAAAAAVLLFLLVAAAATTATSSLDRFHKLPSLFHHSPPHSAQRYIELTRPLSPSSVLTPACTHPIISHSFANTIGDPPFSAPYSPPPSACSPPWSAVILELSFACKGDQYDRIAAVWLSGVELIRTSTAEPTEDGIFWKVRKDVTRYSSLLMRRGLEVSMMLENVIDDEFTGVYYVNATLLFYSQDTGARASPRAGVSWSDASGRKLKLGLGLGMKENGGHGGVGGEDGVIAAQRGEGTWNFYELPADLIVPLSDYGDRGSWYWIESAANLHSKRIRIPANTVRAVLELCVSFHGNDEFWYSNPPDSYIHENNLTTGRGNGAYREVFVMIDGQLVGSEVPFPVVFTGGINPLFWEPVVGIGAFNLPSYDIELTPVLGTLLDCKAHEFTIGVASGISYWLVNANLHLWLDHHSRKVRAKSVVYDSPAHHVERRSRFIGLDGLFKVAARRKEQFVGWVKSSAGNLTTIVSREYKVKNMIIFLRNGTYKLVKQKMKAKREVKIQNEAGILLARHYNKRKYPLRVITVTMPGSRKDSYVLATNVSHAMMEKVSSGDMLSFVNNVQDSGGWMEVKDHSVLSGTATTRQTYSYMDKSFCYLRSVEARDGRITGDDSTFNCPSSL